jgi:hypothetical protein
MLNFKQFLNEEYILEAKGLEGSIGTERKGFRHIMNYVLPYMSDKQRAKFSQRHSNMFNLSKMKPGHGTSYNPDPNATTHTLASSVNGHAAGTPVRVTGVDVDDKGKIMVQTANHGSMQMSKLDKPGELKKPVITKGGFDVEAKIAKNLGTEAAGSTGTAFDYSYRGSEEGGIRGKARKIESDKPYLRGESKQNKAKMGESSIKWDSGTRQWNFTNAKLAPHFSQTMVNGKPILQHLNETFPDGNGKSFSTDAPEGTARTYLNNLGVNSLHLHRTEKATKRKAAIDHGTTFTIGSGNDLQGKTNLGHLDDDEIDKLDGKIRLEAGGHGSIKLSHTPNPTVFKEYADRSRVMEGHGDLTDENHASIFRSHVDNHITSKLNPESSPTPPTTSQPPARRTPSTRFSTIKAASGDWRANQSHSQNLAGSMSHGSNFYSDSDRAEFSKGFN